MDPTLAPMVRVQKDLSPPGDRDFWTDPQEPGTPPLFSTREVAFVFFAKKRLWLQLRMDLTSLDGEPIKVPTSPKGYRQFQLHHVELIAHAFFSQGIIDFRTFTNCIHIVRAIARNYRLI